MPVLSKQLLARLQSSNWDPEILDPSNVVENTSLSEKTACVKSQKVKLVMAQWHSRKEQFSNLLPENEQKRRLAPSKRQFWKVQSSYIPKSSVFEEKSLFSKLRFLSFFIYSRIME